MSEQVVLNSLCVGKIDVLSTSADGDIDYFDISSVDNANKRIIAHQTMRAKDAPSRAKQLVRTDDILVSTVRPNLNAVAMVNSNTGNTMVASTGFCVLRANARADPHYLFHFVQSSRFVEAMVSQATGASYPAVSNSIVKNCSIPLRDLPTQRRIATTLDKVSEGIALCKQMLADLDELVKSQFVEMFGERFSTNRIKVEEIADSTIGLTYKPENTSDTGTIVLRSGNIQNSELTLADDVVRVSGMKIPDSKYVHPGDILMCSRNGSANLVGKCCRIPEVCEEMAFGAFMTVIRSKYPAFLFGFFQSHYFKEQLTNVGTTSINQITTKMLNGYETIEPTKDEEKRFATLLAQIDKSKFAVQQQLVELETLKESLMQEYFG